MRDADKAWAAILRAAENQLRLLTEAVQRPEISPEGLTRNALTLLLDALAAAAQTLSETTQEVAAFSQAYKAYQAATVDVQLHLTALASGWRCPACAGAVARRASVQGVRRGPLVVALICRACDATAPITATGKQAFAHQFGHLQGPSWNPGMNGFTWDGS